MKQTILILSLGFCFQQGFAQEDLNMFDFLIGYWQGVETGAAGDGIGFRTYRYDLGAHFIFVENQSTFPRSEKKPIGEVHRDKGIFSYNANTSAVVFREYHSEGFVNIYELDGTQSSENKFVFVTREIENNPGGWKARLVLTKDSAERFTEEFWIAMDGTNFSPVLKNRWTKVK